jgi:hypothetical protein
LKGGKNDGSEGQESRNRESDLGQAEAEEKDLSREVIVVLRPVAQLIWGAASAKEAT